MAAEVAGEGGGCVAGVVVDGAADDDVSVVVDAVGAVVVGVAGLAGAAGAISDAAAAAAVGEPQWSPGWPGLFAEVGVVWVVGVVVEGAAVVGDGEGVAVAVGGDVGGERVVVVVVVSAGGCLVTDAAIGFVEFADWARY